MLPFVLLLTTLTMVVAPPPPSPAGARPSDMDLLSSILTAGDVKASNPAPANSKPSVIENYVRAFPADGADSTRRPTVTPSLGGTSSAAINCREFVLNLADTLGKCNAVTQRDLNVGVNANAVTGFCRWDQSALACWCPRPRSLCEDLKQCYWNKDPALTGNPQLSVAGGECISNAERFYNILSNLLLKRGKKDFAIRINYSSAPARGQLPLGPYGPAIIGGGSMPGGNPNYAPGYGAPMGYPALPPQLSLPQYGPPQYGLPQYGPPPPPPPSFGYGPMSMGGYQ